MKNLSYFAEKFNLDKFGISASLLCAIHCAFMPLLLPLAAMLGLGFLWEPAFEIAMILLALAVGAISITSGYLNVHRNIYPYIFLVSGIAMIIATKLFFDHHFEPVLLPIGALLIVASHWFNYRLHQQYAVKSCAAH